MTAANLHNTASQIMKSALCLLLIATLLFTGCRTTSSTQTSMFRKPCWWERRMERLDTWDRRHGYIVTNTVENTRKAAIYTLCATALVGSMVLVALAEAENRKNNRNVEVNESDSWFTMEGWW